jgi:hypothetical protein
MKTGFEFIQRMQEDAEFRRKVNACLEGEERLAFLKNEGYDFTPFVQIIDNVVRSAICRLVGTAGGKCQPQAGRFRFFGSPRPTIPYL